MQPDPSHNKYVDHNQNVPYGYPSNQQVPYGYPANQQAPYGYAANQPPPNYSYPTAPGQGFPGHPPPHHQENFIVAQPVVVVEPHREHHHKKNKGKHDGFKNICHSNKYCWIGCVLGLLFGWCAFICFFCIHSDKSHKLIKRRANYCRGVCIGWIIIYLIYIVIVIAGSIGGAKNTTSSSSDTFDDQYIFFQAQLSNQPHSGMKVQITDYQQEQFQFQLSLHFVLQYPNTKSWQLSLNCCYNQINLNKIYFDEKNPSEIGFVSFDW